MNRSWQMAVAWLAVAVSAQPAIAAPYCVSVQGIPDQCLYYDGRQCQDRATQLGGVCSANSDEIVTPSGPGSFCLVDGGRTVSCLYQSRQACNIDARRRRAACVQATAPATQGVDPFAIRRPY